MTTFTKNQAAFLINNWNLQGKFAITAATVHSCGKKQMVLNDAATGECLGRNFNPAVTQWDGEVRADLTAEQAEVRAVELAAEFLAKEIARLNNILARNADQDPSYLDGIKHDIAEMQAATPNFIWR